MFDTTEVTRSEPPATRSLVLWCPDWPIVAAGVATDEAAMVMHANRVVAASPAARADGVVEGLRRRQAQGRCPSAKVLDHDPDRDARAFEPLVASLDVLCPRVEVTRPGTVTLGTRGPSRYHGGDTSLAEKVEAVFGGAMATLRADSRSVPLHVGIADGWLAATCAARQAQPGEPLVIEPGASPAFLAPWSLSVFDGEVLLDRASNAPNITDVLKRLGIATMGALAALPAADILGRFGNDGELLNRLARGLDTRPLATRQPADDLAVSIEPEPAIERVDTAAFVAVALADELHQKLGSSGLACTRLAISATTEHGESLERCWRHEGTLTAGAVAERVRWQLDGWLSAGAATRPSAGINRLTLTPLEVVPARGRQLGFWGGETLLDERAARALARVAGMLGTEAVLVPERRGGRGPGEQLKLLPAALVELNEPRPAARPEAVSEPWPGRLPAPSPALVPPEPPAVELLDEADRPVGVSGRGVATGEPMRLVHSNGRSEAVQAWAGPWTSDERWWDPPNHRRRARIQLITTTGQAHLLVLEGGNWWLEGSYD